MAQATAPGLAAVAGGVAVVLSGGHVGGDGRTRLKFVRVSHHLLNLVRAGHHQLNIVRVGPRLLTSAGHHLFRGNVGT